MSAEPTGDSKASSPGIEAELELLRKQVKQKEAEIAANREKQRQQNAAEEQKQKLQEQRKQQLESSLDQVFFHCSTDSCSVYHAQFQSLSYRITAFCLGERVYITLQQAAARC